MSDVTQILTQIEQGDARAAEQLLPLVYDELRRLAAARLANERPGQTLQATALVHEAYLRLVHGTQASQWASRTHFFAAAAEAMRRILVESARRKSRLKHGGGRQRVDLDAIEPPVELPRDEILAVDEALTAFEQEQPRMAELVKLRYFAGYTQNEAAEVLGISSATAERYWRYARAWLAERLRE